MELNIIKSELSDDTSNNNNFTSTSTPKIHLSPSYNHNKKDSLIIPGTYNDHPSNSNSKRSSRNMSKRSSLDILVAGIETSVQLLNVAANLGSLSSMFLLRNNKNDESSNLEKLIRLGIIYADGEAGVEKDEVKALDIFQDAANNGNIIAKSILTLSNRFKFHKNIPNEQKLTEEEVITLNNAKEVVDNVILSKVCKKTYKLVLTMKESKIDLEELKMNLTFLKQNNQLAICSTPQKVDQFGIAKDEWGKFIITKLNSYAATLTHFAVIRRRLDIIYLLQDFGVDMEIHLIMNNEIVKPSDIARRNNSYLLQQYFNSFEPGYTSHMNPIIEVSRANELIYNENDNDDSDLCERSSFASCIIS